MTAQTQAKKEASQRWAAKNRHRLNAYQKRWVSSHKELHASYQKRKYEKNKKDPTFLERRRAAARDRFAPGPKWGAAKIVMLRHRAKKLGVPFDLVAADLVVPELCPVLGIPLVFRAGKNHPNGPSVDRIIPSLGYVKTNILIISYRANALKHDCTDPEEFERVLNYIRTPSRYVETVH